MAIIDKKVVGKKSVNADTDEQHTTQPQGKTINTVESISSQQSTHNIGENLKIKVNTTLKLTVTFFVIYIR